MYIVRQGQLIEEHEVPHSKQQSVFCRYYRAGQWFGNQELLNDKYGYRITRIMNYSDDYHTQPTEPKQKAYKRTLTNLNELSSPAAPWVQRRSSTLVDKQIDWTNMS